MSDDYRRGGTARYGFNYGRHVLPSNESKHLSRLSPCCANVSCSAASCARVAPSIAVMASRRAIAATPSRVLPARSERSSSPLAPPPPPPPPAATIPPPRGPGLVPLRSAASTGSSETALYTVRGGVGVGYGRLVHGGGEVIGELDARDGVGQVEGHQDGVLGGKVTEHLASMAI
eukprot:scaffold36955_cov69-Phaeocystis_antarctica.AAC.13